MSNAQGSPNPDLHFLLLHTLQECQHSDPRRRLHALDRLGKEYLEDDDAEFLLFL